MDMGWNASGGAFQYNLLVCMYKFFSTDFLVLHFVPDLMCIVFTVDDAETLYDCFL